VLIVAHEVEGYEGRAAQDREEQRLVPGAGPLAPALHADKLQELRCARALPVRRVSVKGRVGLALGLGLGLWTEAEARLRGWQQDATSSKDTPGHRQHGRVCAVSAWGT